MTKLFLAQARREGGASPLRAVTTEQRGLSLKEPVRLYRYLRSTTLAQTVRVLFTILRQAIPVAPSPLRLPASLARFASIAYPDNISSFFAHISSHPTIQISGCNQPASSALGARPASPRPVARSAMVTSEEGTPAGPAAATI